MAQVVIDSLNGYLAGIPDEKHLELHMHELVTYLSLKNVVSLVTLSQHGLFGEETATPLDVSTYIASISICASSSAAFLPGSIA